MKTKKKLDQNRRVVITGLGVISSLGIGWQEFWKNLIAGKSGISKITTFDTSKYDHHYGGEVRNFNPTQFMSSLKAKSLGRASQMIIAASKLALKDANILPDDFKKYLTAFSIGTTGGERRVIEELNRDVLANNRLTLPKSVLLASRTENLISSVCSELKISGHANVFSTACSSGNYAISEGFDLIRSGRFDYALVGGGDSFSQMVFTGFNRLLAVAPEKCQPFDKNRKGMIPAEGSGILFLESLESAERRKVKPYAEILGSGLSCDAAHITDPKSGGVSKAMLKAIRNSSLKPMDIDYINAHGTGTLENDLVESQAINRVFKESVKKIPVTSIKSMLGHAMGAAAALEAISCCLTLTDDIIPPTINLTDPDPKCDINCVALKALKKDVKIVMNNSLAFGGNNCCVILGKINER